MLDKEDILSSHLKDNIFRVKTDEKKIFLVTLSDLHIGLGSRQYVQDIVKFILSVPNMYVVLGGDMLNNTTHTSKGVVLEEYASGQEQLNLLVEYIKPLVENNRLIAVFGGGNHERRSYEDCFISLPQMVATLLEVPNLYIPDIAIGFLDIGSICYIYGLIHKHRRTQNYYDHMNCDILVMEHTHELSVKEKLVLSHNKYAKTTSLKTVYEINNGSALALPNYAKVAGYRPQNIGCYIIELSGTKRDIIVWKDTDLFKAIQGGYTT